MSNSIRLADILERRGVSRRGFMKFSAGIASLMALPPSMIPRIAAALEGARRPSLIYLSFQECTGCTESLTRSHAPTLEGLIFEAISLDYHHTLQAAAGHAAEAARLQAMEENAGSYLVAVDGSVPLGNPGYSTIAGVSNVDMLKETVAGAAAVIAIGTCASGRIQPGPCRFQTWLRTNPLSMSPVARRFQRSLRACSPSI
jgi:hydrogenase small subunit